MPASLTILAVVAISALTKAAVSCGEEPTISTPCEENLSLTSGLSSARNTSRFTWLTSARGVAAGLSQDIRPVLREQGEIVVERGDEVARASIRGRHVESASAIAEVGGGVAHVQAEHLPGRGGTDIDLGIVA